MKTMKRTLLIFSALVAVSGSAGVAGAQGSIAFSDLFVPHVSTLRANTGQVIPLHVRHKSPEAQAGQEIDPADRVVLFVHGGTVPSVPAFDLNYEDYSWMDHLARAGFDVWGMDLTGYGSSARPMMDDPCNVDPEKQELLIGEPLEETCAPHYPYEAQTLSDEWDQIDSVVDYVREQTGVDKVSLVGWSAGGPRVGGYVAQNPEKVNRVVLFAPSPAKPDAEVVTETAPGFPTSLQTRDVLFNDRWESNVKCEGQVDPAVRERLWTEIMAWDRIGANWGADGVMRSPKRTRADWPVSMVSEITAPLLVITAQYDRPDERRTVYDQAGSSDKVLVEVDCGSHFMVYEKPRSVLHEASVEWLKNGQVQNVKSGAFKVDEQGSFSPMQ